MRHLVFSFSATLLLAACGQADDLDAEIGGLSLPIVNGVDSSDDDNTVVYVHSGLDTACSGTVIAPNLVATALHCITDKYPGFFACEPDGTLTQSSEEAGTGQLGNLYPANEISVRLGAVSNGAPAAAHGVRLFSTGSTQICRGDIAFVVLDTPLDVPVTPVRLDYGVRAGDTVRVLGYGSTEKGTSSVRFARDGVRIIDVGPTSEDETAISAAPRTFVVSEGPCQGDSGGPALSESTGALVGVYSLAAGESCTGVGVRNVYTSLSSFSGLALDAFEAAGAEPVLDAAPAEPEKPGVVPESGCTLASTPSPSSGGAASALALGALALGLIARRRG